MKMNFWERIGGEWENKWTVSRWVSRQSRQVSSGRCLDKCRVDKVEEGRGVATGKRKS